MAFKVNIHYLNVIAGLIKNSNNWYLINQVVIDETETSNKVLEYFKISLERFELKFEGIH